jgi:hypothetical protein
VDQAIKILQNCGRQTRLAFSQAMQAPAGSRRMTARFATCDISSVKPGEIIHSPPCSAFSSRTSTRFATLYSVIVSDHLILFLSTMHDSTFLLHSLLHTLSSIVFIIILMLAIPHIVCTSSICINTSLALASTVLLHAHPRCIAPAPSTSPYLKTCAPLLCNATPSFGYSQTF